MWVFAIIGMLAVVLGVVVVVYLVVATFSTYPDHPSSMQSPTTDRRTTMAQAMSTATIEVFRAKSIRQRWRFRIRNANGQVTGQSSEAYTTRANAFRGARDFRDSMIGPVGLREVER